MIKLTFSYSVILPLSLIFDHISYNHRLQIRSIATNGIWDLNSEKGKKNLAAEKKILITALSLFGNDHDSFW